MILRQIFAFGQGEYQPHGGAAAPGGRVTSSRQFVHFRRQALEADRRIDEIAQHRLARSRVAGEGEYGNVYVTMMQVLLTRRTHRNQRDLRKLLAQVFSRAVRTGVAERRPHGVETGSGLRGLILRTPLRLRLRARDLG